MPDASFPPDLDGEADQVSLQAVPGAVFLRLRHDRGDGTAHRMFIELGVDDALALRRELDYVINLAAATA